MQNSQQMPEPTYILIPLDLVLQTKRLSSVTSLEETDVRSTNFNE